MTNPGSTSFFTPAQIARSNWYRRRALAATAASSLVAYLLLVVIAIACSQDWLVFRLNRPAWLPTLLVVIVVLHVVLALPIVVARLYVFVGPAKKVELAALPMRDWWKRTLKGFLVSLALQLVVGTSAFFVVRDAPECWLVLWGLLALVTALTALIAPLLSGGRSALRPVPPELRSRAESYARQVGVRLPKMLLLQQPTMRVKNAYVSGMGPFRRLTITESLLTMEPGIVDAVLVHELAHVRHRDVETMTGLRAVLQIIPVGLVAAIVSHDLAPVRIAPATYPVLLLYLLSGLGFSLLPLILLRRHQEQRADRLALTVTRDPSSFKALIAEASVANFDDLAERRKFAGGLSRVHQTPIARISTADEWGKANGAAGVVGEPSPSLGDTSEDAPLPAKGPGVPADDGSARPSQPPFAIRGWNPKMAGRIATVGVVATAFLLIPHVRFRALLETHPICYPAVPHLETLRTPRTDAIAIDGIEVSPPAGLLSIPGFHTAPLAVVHLQPRATVTTSRLLARPLNVMLATGCYFMVATNPTSTTKAEVYSNAQLSGRVRGQLIGIVDRWLRRTPAVASATFLP